MINPSTLDFGAVPVGVQKTSSVTLTNNGKSPASISQVAATGNGFSITAGPQMPLVLSAGQSSILTLAFQPASAGSASGSISVSASGGTSKAALSGSGLAPGQLGVTPSAMNFGSVTVGSSQNQTGALTAGNSGVTVSSASWNGTGYSLSGITFPVSIAAGKTVPFVVTFTPQGASSSAGSIAFTSSASNSPAKVALSGTGVQQPHSVSLAWNASTSAVAGYNVYRAGQSGGPYALISSSLQLGTTYSDNGVQPGSTYFYVVTAVDASSQESSYSNESMAVIPAP